MPGMGDIARMMAASGGGGTAGDTGSPDMEAQDPNSPDGLPSAGGGMDQIEQGISMIEGSLDGLPGDLAEKARKHLEGLKEIVSQGEAAGGTPDDQDPSADTPDGANASQIESPSEPQVGGSAMSY